MHWRPESPLLTSRAKALALRLINYHEKLHSGRMSDTIV